MGFKSKTAQKLNFGKEGSLVRSPDSVQINEGETLQGVLIGVDETTLAGGPHNYTMEEKDRGLVTFLGTAALDRLLKDEKDSLVRITYKGSIKASGSGFDVKQFEVEVWDEEEEPSKARK